MILQNFKKAIGGVLANASNDRIVAVNVNGEEQALAYSGGVSMMTNNLGKENVYDVNQYSALLLGTGTGEITEDDYCLFEIFSDYTTVSVQLLPQYGIRGSKDLIILNKTIQNTSDTPFTITEMGWAGKYDRLPACMFTHDLLETPVTLQPDDMYTFTLRIKL